VLSLISINHIFKIKTFPFLSVTVLGLVGWAVILLSLILLTRSFRRQAFVVFLLFFSFGAWFGPFLEPPADPFEHLRRTHNYCEKKADELPQKNRGFWHYSMSAVVLCGDTSVQDVNRTLLKLNILHGVYQGLLVTALFVLAKNAGLPDRWAFLSCCISFLFFGTNRFSFYSYYSFAPTFSSMFIYWLWTAAFFFKKNSVALVSGILCALLVVPILWVNHLQEVFLLGLLVVVWLSLNTHERIWSYLNTSISAQGGDTVLKKISLFRMVYLSVIIFTLFFLPQWKFFQESVSTLFVRDFWLSNQRVIFSWEGWHLIGKIWGFRVDDTFSWIGLLVIILAIPFFCIGHKSNDKKIRVFLLSVLPFIGYFIPLVHFVWLSNVDVSEYYRLCYSSMFWLFFSYFFWEIEDKLISTARVLCRRRGD